MKITFKNDDKDLLMRGIAKFIDTGFVSRLEVAVDEIKAEAENCRFIADNSGRSGEVKRRYAAELTGFSCALDAIYAAFPELKEE